MKRIALVVAASTAIAPAPTTAAASSENDHTTTNLADLDLDLSGLPTEPQTFDLRMHGKSYDRGAPFPLETTLTLQTAYEGSRIVFNDTLDFMGRRFAFHLVCEPRPTLPLDHAEVRMEHSARSLCATAVRDPDADTITITTSAGATTTTPFPDDTITQAALLRIVTRLPRTPGRTYRFSAYCPLSKLEPATPDSEPHCTLTCRGRTTTKIDGRPVECTEYVANFEGALTLLVDDDATLRKIIAYHAQTEMVLVPADAALAEARDE